MSDDPEKIADVGLQQRAALMAENQQMREAIMDIRELVEGEVDIDRNGGPNLAMKVMAVVNLVVKE